MSEAYQSLTHSRWNCKYHVVFVPKRRRKALFGHIRQALGPVVYPNSADNVAMQAIAGAPPHEISCTRPSPPV